MRIDFRWVALLIVLDSAGACARAGARHAADPPSFRGVYEIGRDRSAFRESGGRWLQCSLRSRPVATPPGHGLTIRWPLPWRSWPTSLRWNLETRRNSWPPCNPAGRADPGARLWAHAASPRVRARWSETSGGMSLS